MKRNPKRLKHKIDKAYKQTSYLYLVNVRLINNGTHFDSLMLFDTGASITLISERAFAFLNIDLVGSQALMTGLGKVTTDMGIVGTILLDGIIEVNDVEVGVLDKNFGIGNVTGVLGGSFLKDVGFYMGNGIIWVHWLTSENI